MLCLLHNHLAVHHHPVSRKSAEIRIAAWFRWSVEANGKLILGSDDVGVGEHVVGSWNVLTGDGVGLGDDLVDQVADACPGSGLIAISPVVRDRVGIDQCELDRLARAGARTKAPCSSDSCRPRLSRLGRL